MVGVAVFGFDHPSVAPPPPWRPPTITAIRRGELIGGVINEYAPA
jgi:hypothetical protein